MNTEQAIEDNASDIPMTEPLIAESNLPATRLRPRMFRDPLETTWLDQDESGDYDPKNDMPASFPRKRKRDTLRQNDEEGESDSDAKSNDSKPFVQYGKELLLGMDYPPPGSRWGGVVQTGPTKVWCESCRSNLLDCSYRAENHDGPCKQCTSKGRKCVKILPATAMKGQPLNKGSQNSPHTGATLKEWLLEQGSKTFIPGPEDNLPCDQCVTDKRRCSLIAHRIVEGICARCHDLEIDCTFKPREREEEEAPRAKRTKVLTQESEFDEDATDVDEDTAETDENASKIDENASKIDENASGPETRQSHPGTLRTITTRFAHPVTFFCDVVDDASSDPCNWCQNLVYGINGMSEVTVGVIDYHDGQGFIEISGNGHTARSGKSTRMCENCTLERAKICACKIHELELLPDGMQSALVGDNVYPYFGEGMAEKAPFNWCDVCPGIASHFCIRQAVTFGESDSQSQECGLILCEACALGMQECGGNLDLLIAKREEDTDGFVRSDVEFLKMDGELAKRVWG
ncbi:hypothetical protein MMC20_004024 [Loxospora ochrophaea]|nr:hypothetical protein [Loxospora ochrophaea]